jgi:hypothetical protein
VSLVSRSSLSLHKNLENKLLHQIACTFIESLSSVSKALRRQTIADVASIALALFIEMGGWGSESQWRSGSVSVSNARGSGFEPRQEKGFSSSYETPELLGAGDSHVLRMRR